MKHITRFVALASFSAVALAASVPFTFSAGSPAVASQLNANFTALADAVTALEAKVAALEGAVPLTRASVAGTYRLLSLGSKAISSSTDLSIGAGTSSTSATVVLAQNGTFTFSGVERMSGFSARFMNCTGVNCSPNGFVNTEGPARSTSSGGGTWRLGTGNTIVIIPADGSALTVYLSQDGHTGFSVESEDQVNGAATGQRLQVDVLIKQ